MTSTRKMAARALAVGLIGYATVVVFYAVVDAIAGRGVLYTGEVLGRAFFRHVQDPNLLADSVPFDLEALLWHNVMHLSVAVTIGFIVIGLVEDALRNPAKSGFVLFTLFLGFAVTVAAMRFITAPMDPLLPLWTIVVANAMAAGIAGQVILGWYPGLWERFSRSNPGLQPQPESVQPESE